MAVMVDLYCASYKTPPDAVTLDIDDTVDVVHGHQQPSLFNAHYDEDCFLPIHVYDIATSRPVAVLLRPDKTPSGIEIRGHMRRLVRRLRRHWPQTRITIRGDGLYGRPEAMEWCDGNGVNFVFGLPGNAVLDRAVDEIADDVRTRRALDQKPCLRGFVETSYRAKSWNKARRACARIGPPPSASTSASRRSSPPTAPAVAARSPIRRHDRSCGRRASVAVRPISSTALNKSGYDVAATKIALKSLTLVRVGPVITRSPSRANTG
jgi:hypothetical protein